MGLPRLRYGGSNYRCSDRNQPEQHHPWSGILRMGRLRSAFGPLVLCSLFWRRTNKQGAYAGIIVGGVVDLVWAQLSGGIFDLYEIVPGFVFGLLAIVVVSLLTPAPTKAVTDEFDSYRHCVE